MVQLLSADIIDRGIVLAGVGALLKNLDKRIPEETGLPVCIADDPLCCVVVSTNEILSNFKLLRRISIEWVFLGFRTQSKTCWWRKVVR